MLRQFIFPISFNFLIIPCGEGSDLVFANKEEHQNQLPKGCVKL
jgi:hypothetical protein